MFIMAPHTRTRTNIRMRKMKEDTIAVTTQCEKNSFVYYLLIDRSSFFPLKLYGAIYDGMIDFRRVDRLIIMHVLFK